MIGKKKAAKAELNEKTDIKTPVSEMVRKFKKQKNSVVALFFILFLVFLALFGETLAPFKINEYDYN